MTATEKQQQAVTDAYFSEGEIMVEFVCPIRCNGLVFGVTTLGRSPITVSQTFLSSTMRTVSVLLNLTEHEVRYYINHRYHKKHKSQKLKARGLAWHFFVEFKEPGNYVIMNPMARAPVPDHLLMQT